MKKRYLSAILVITAFFIISANTNVEPVSTEEFKNLKILPKDITKEKLDSVMANFSVSLGVRCGFCHAANKDTTIRRPDFASDEKAEKDIARSMMQMTAYLNANYFNPYHSTQPDTIHAVVCYSCHRGTKAPDANAFLSLIDSTIQSHGRK